MLKNTVLILLVIAAFGACKNKKKPENTFKGFVVWEEGYTTFTDCGSGKEYWLEDKTGQVQEAYKKIAKETYQRVYFSFEADLLPPATTGAASAFDNIMSVKNVVEFADTAPAKNCKTITGKPIFNCSGNNPSWAITFEEVNIKFTAGYPNDTLAYFPLIEPQIRDSAGVGRIFYYATGNENWEHLEIIVIEKICTGASGSKQSRFSAKVKFGDFTYEGCAKLKTIPNEQTAATTPTGRANGLRKPETGT
ncbi:MAG TPA: hypothetical protein VEC12_09015 [Bacteroidia bacterium]|nr:hypothetical protein [Bacteroidia bacterium]